MAAGDFIRDAEVEPRQPEVGEPDRRLQRIDGVHVALAAHVVERIDDAGIGALLRLELVGQDLDDAVDVVLPPSGGENPACGHEDWLRLQHGDRFAGRRFGRPLVAVELERFRDRHPLHTGASFAPRLDVRLDAFRKQPDRVLGQALENGDVAEADIGERAPRALFTCPICV